MDLPLTYLSVQDLPVAVGLLPGPCIFSIKGNITLLFAQHCLQVLFGYSLGGLSIAIDMGALLAFAVFLHSRPVQHELCSI